MDGDVPSPTPSELDAFKEVTNTTEEPNLPLPMQPGRTSGIGMFNLAAIGRKRTIEEAMNPSSDLPMFSSDDLSASLETYSSQNRKRQHMRHWWDNRRTSLLTEVGSASVRRKRSPFTRKDDSGIWMNSDDFEPAMEDATSCLFTGFQSSSNQRILVSNQHTADISMSREAQENNIPPYWQHRTEDNPEIHAIQARASGRIHNVVESTVTVFDLSYMDLHTLLSSTLRPLHLLTRYLTDFTPDETFFDSLDIKLSLNLTGNNLQMLPGEIYKLNISTLSARHNQIADISPSIANLHDLQELNLSVNNLRYLPFEILELCRGKLTGLRTQSNPFLEPFPRHWDANTPLLSDDTFKEWIYAKEPTLRAYSTVAYFDAFGKVCRGSCPAPSRVREYLHPPERPWIPLDSTSHNSHAPVSSLTELCLQACQGSVFLEDFATTSANEEGLPESIIPLLQEAWMTQDAGKKLCSVCKRAYIIPRTEWLEWWSHFTTHETMTKPFIRRGCSWACIPDREALPDEWKDCGWGFSSSRGEDPDSMKPPGLTEDPARANVPRIWPAVARELRLNLGARHEGDT